MALSEFVAMESAYRALQQLDSAARVRALRWLADALGSADVLTDAVSESDTPVAAVVTVPATTPAPVVAPNGEATRPRGAEQSANGASAKSRGGRAAKKAAGRRAPARGTRGTSGKANTPDAPPRTRRARAAATPTDGGDGERVYRRMPAPDVVLAAYRQVGTVSGLADHFQVPRHTVQGWARRLRRDGYEIGRGA